MLIVGIDEAGYGPNLGPLVVAASAWWVADPTTDLYAHLAGFVCRDPAGPGLALGDSKLIYAGSQGLARLERGVLAVWHGAVTAARATRLSSLLGTPLAACPWYAGYDPELPAEADVDETHRHAEAFRRATGVRPLGLWMRVVEAGEFNAGCRQAGSKGALLSSLSIELARSVVEQCRPLLGSQPLTAVDGQVRLLFDKHGGRSYYAGLLQHHFGCDWIEPMVEQQRESCYRWNTADDRFTASFRCKGESQLPTAVASMTAKYVRELSLRAFNAYWQRVVTGLRPTAGYPVDARRFRTEIAAAQRELGIADEILWRER